MAHSDAAHLLQRQLLSGWLEWRTDIMLLDEAIVQLQLPLGALAQAIGGQLVVAADGSRERGEHGRAVEARVRRFI